jgi:ketosteroid isomerase-like protein
MSAEDVVREIVESCWSDVAGPRRLAELVTPDYVHHTVAGDWDLDQFVAGLAWVATRLDHRVYRVQHVVVAGDMAAAYVVWTARRSSDGEEIVGRGAYHCRFRDGAVCEDWDVFHPMPT